MKLDPNDILLGAALNAVPFESPFPSEDASFDGQLAKLMDFVGPNEFGSMGQQVLARASAEAWRTAQSLINKAKATVVGDIPRDWMPDIAWLEQAGVNKVVRGLWSAVAFPSTESSAALVQSIVDVGLDAALKAVGAVPIIGWIAQAAIAFGRTLFRIFTAKDVAEPEKRYQLPWVQYVKESDTEIVRRFLIDYYAPAVDWSPIWLPPTNPNRTWKLAEGTSNGKVIGKIFAPLTDKGEVDWSPPGLGAIPNTFRVAGLIQTRGSVYSQGLVRFWNDGSVMQWGPQLTQTGDFRPAQAQASGQLWQQVQRAGNPDMYKVQASQLETAWHDWFQGFFESVWAAAEKDEWLGDLAAPYITVERGPDVRLGIPWRSRPQPAPFVWPEIVNQGPARPTARTPCLWAEEDLDKDIRPGESPDPFFWPWRTEPQQTSFAQKYKIVDGHLAAQGPAMAPNESIWRGWRCVSWPAGTDLLSVYRWPFESIVGPALKRLAELQRTCLRRTFVCAMVRPFEVQGLKPYGAFVGAAGKAMRDRCVDARKALLASPQRMMVSYQDAKLIDPEFAAALADSGVPTTEVARQAAFRKFGLTPGINSMDNGGGIGPDVPPPLAPQGGVAFGGEEDPGGGSGPGHGPGGAPPKAPPGGGIISTSSARGGSGIGLALGGAALLLGGGLLAHRVVSKKRGRR